MTLHAPVEWISFPRIVDADCGIAGQSGAWNQPASDVVEVRGSSGGDDVNAIIYAIGLVIVAVVSALP